MASSSSSSPSAPKRPRVLNNIASSSSSVPKHPSVLCWRVLQEAKAEAKAREAETQAKEEAKARAIAEARKKDIHKVRAEEEHQFREDFRHCVQAFREFFELTMEPPWRWSDEEAAEVKDKQDAA